MLGPAQRQPFARRCAQAQRLLGGASEGGGLVRGDDPAGALERIDLRRRQNGLDILIRPALQHRRGGAERLRLDAHARPASRRRHKRAGEADNRAIAAGHAQDVAVETQLPSLSLERTGSQIGAFGVAPDETDLLRLVVEKIPLRQLRRRQQEEFLPVRRQVEPDNQSFVRAHAPAVAEFFHPRGIHGLGQAGAQIDAAQAAGEAPGQMRPFGLGGVQGLLAVDDDRVGFQRGRTEILGDQRYAQTAGRMQRRRETGLAAQMNQLDPFPLGQDRQAAAIQGRGERIARVEIERQEHAAARLQFADQRPVAAGDQGARPGLPQRRRRLDAGKGVRPRIEGGKQLQDGASGQMLMVGDVLFAPWRHDASPAKPRITRSKSSRPHNRNQMTQDHMTQQFFNTAPGQPRLAYLSRAGLRGPGLFWLGGYRSDMRGSKATFVDAFAAEQDLPFLRFDYSGHGNSEGEFVDGTIGLWAEQALKIFRALTVGPQVVIGSSMGGWIALLLARELARLGETDRLAGMTLIAPAADFSESLVWPHLPQQVRDTLARDGVWRDEQNVFTQKFFDDGRSHSVLGGEVRTWCPVRILQGMRDDAVPWRHALKLLEHLAADPATLTLIRDGDHRLSRPQDLDLLRGALQMNVAK